MRQPRVLSDGSGRKGFDSQKASITHPSSSGRSATCNRRPRREVRYLMREEWAQTADDVLWRRSKLGLRFSPAQAAALEAFMREAGIFR
jgi:glycerol-3-phosphate dehydrogenase